MNANLEKRILLIKKYNKECENPKNGKKKLFSLSAILKTSMVMPSRSVSISSSGQCKKNDDDDDTSLRMAKVTQSFKETSYLNKNRALFDNVFITYSYNKKNLFRNCAKLIKVSPSLTRHSRSYMWIVDINHVRLQHRRAVSLPQVIYLVSIY
jgi:hypothetical protein